MDESGHPQFNDLLYRRAEPFYFAFDVLSLDGKDLRHLPLLQRKKILKRLLHGRSECLVYVDHIDGDGVWLFEQACQLDLEGIVAKHRHGKYIDQREASTWVKIKNARYTQVAGRDERFQRLERPHEPLQAGWASCEAAVATVSV